MKNSAKTIITIIMLQAFFLSNIVWAADSYGKSSLRKERLLSLSELWRGKIVISDTDNCIIEASNMRYDASLKILVPFAFRMMEDLEDMLSSLAQMGVKFQLNTAQSLPYLRGIVIATFLQDYIDENSDIFSRDGNKNRIIFDNKRGKKTYIPILKANNLTPQEAMARVIVMGDDEIVDIPDIPGVVFMNVTIDISANIIKEIMNLLLTKGEGNFNAGFKELFGEKGQDGIYHFGNISFRLSYNFTQDGVTIPTISDIETMKNKAGSQMVNSLESPADSILFSL